MDNVPIVGITAGIGDAKAMLATRQIRHVAGLCSVREDFPLSLFFFIGSFEAPCVSITEKAPRLALCQVGNRMTPIANRSKRKLPVKIWKCFTRIIVSHVISLIKELRTGTCGQRSGLLNFVLWLPGRIQNQFFILRLSFAFNALKSRPCLRCQARL